MIVGLDAASGKRAMRVPACLHSLRASVFTRPRVIDASIIAMTAAGMRRGRENATSANDPSAPTASDDSPTAPVLVLFRHDYSPFLTNSSD
jgi:hypothetical protein